MAGYGEKAKKAAPETDARKLRKRHLERYTSLKNARSPWDAQWREVGEYLAPERTRFVTSDTNRGEKRHSRIINSSPLRSSRILASGMMAGLTSPSRPWFRLATPDAALSERHAVRAWLDVVGQRIRLAHHRSNVYTALFGVYQDISDFGTHALILDEDEEDTIRAYGYTVGEYVLATNARNRVDTLAREVALTVSQLVERFPDATYSRSVKTFIDQHRWDERVDVLHVIEPNRGFKDGQLGPEGKRFLSTWMELKGDEDCGFLHLGGYDEFPGLCPRWGVIGADVYGRGPGQAAIGDAKALQILERRKAQAAEKIVNPPMVAPTSLENGRVSLLPGDVTYLDSPSGAVRFEPAYVLNPNAISVFAMEIQQHERRVAETYFADLWLMMQQMGGGSDHATAREIAERKEEKMLQLGPVLERLNDELLDPLITRTFNVLLKKGEIPPPPEELQGQVLRVEYVSILAQAQKMIGISALERLIGVAGQMAQLVPGVLDKIDADEFVDQYADALGTPTAVVRSDEDVAAIRKGREAQAQAQAKAAAMQQMAETAKTASQANLETDNPLSRMLGGLSPAAAGAGQA